MFDKPDLFRTIIDLAPTNNISSLASRKVLGHVARSKVTGVFISIIKTSLIMDLPTSLLILSCMKERFTRQASTCSNHKKCALPLVQPFTSDNQISATASFIPIVHLLQNTSGSQIPLAQLSLLKYLQSNIHDEVLLRKGVHRSARCH